MQLCKIILLAVPFQVRYGVLRCGAKHTFYIRNFMDTKSMESYEAAVHALNGLQSNAAYIKKAREERSSKADFNITVTRNCLGALGIQDEDINGLNVIHVSGTKGKGSTCAFTEAILRCHGLKTGFFSSPHLISVNERIRINGRPIDKELFAKYFWEVYNGIQKTLGPDERMPSYFLFLTVMAFYVFKHEHVNVAVIEVGIGGLYDCTNIIQKPVVVGVSTLGLDHVSILGDSLSQIAEQKAGIFKLGVPAYTVPQPEVAMKVLQRKAQLLNCPFYVCPPCDMYRNVPPSLRIGVPGLVQSLNASLALQISSTWLKKSCMNGLNGINSSLQCENLGSDLLVPLASPFELSSTFQKALHNFVWPGRFQTIRRDRYTFYLDGAHTSESMRYCSQWFDEAASQEAEKEKNTSRVLLFNCTGERKAESLLNHLIEVPFDVAVFCPNQMSVAPNSYSDRCNLTVEPSVELQKCQINNDIWCHLMRSYHENAVSEHSYLSSNLCNGISNRNNYDIENSVIFPCLSDALKWLMLESDRNGQQHNYTSSPKYSELQEMLKKSQRTQILITGSIHLVGNVLSLIDPNLTSSHVVLPTQMS